MSTRAGGVLGNATDLGTTHGSHGNAILTPRSKHELHHRKPPRRLRRTRGGHVGLRVQSFDAAREGPGCGAGLLYAGIRAARAAQARLSGDEVLAIFPRAPVSPGGGPRGSGGARRLAVFAARGARIDS